MKTNDPCIAVCVFDGRTGWCTGCGRTIPEIRAWRTMTPYRRTALLRALPRRVAQVSRNGMPDRATPERSRAPASRRGRSDLV